MFKPESDEALFALKHNRPARVPLRQAPQTDNTRQPEDNHM